MRSAVYIKLYELQRENAVVYFSDERAVFMISPSLVLTLDECRVIITLPLCECAC